MAVFPDVDGSLKSPADIHAWTVSAMESVDVIPLTMPAVEPEAAVSTPAPKKALVMPHRYPTTTSKRVKGYQKEEPTRPGNRHRRRWENANLVGVPNVQPPQPIDFLLRPSHPVRNVPYHLASLWDREQADEVAACRLRAQKRNDRARGSAPGAGRGEIPRDLRDAMKRSSATGAWVCALEDIVRTFLARQADGWEHVDDSDSDGMDGVDEDEMIVVVADDKVHGSRSVDGKLVFDDLGEGEAGTYKRWLAHAIADYYGLPSRSMTVGKGSRSRRIVQIEGRALPPPSPVLVPMRSSTNSIAAFLPRPLSEICPARG